MNIRDVRIGKFGLINNFLPYFRLEQKGVPIIEASPKELAQMFEKGKIDFAPVPSFFYIKNKERLKSHDFCVASRKKVLSVIVVSSGKMPCDDNGCIAVTDQTTTSLNLLRIILRERGMKNRVVPVSESRAGELLKHCDQALVIGDEAIRARMTYRVVMDLGEQWHKLTGCPMVFGISVSLRERNMTEIDKVVMESVRWGRKNIDTVVAEAEKKFNIERNFLELYFKSLAHCMGGSEKRGLELFEEKCREHGLL